MGLSSDNGGGHPAVIDAADMRPFYCHDKLDNPK
jgi:hypothetical protein